MTVHFASVGDIREFVSLASLQTYGIEVCDESHCVNATSFMELFTLDFTKPLTVRVDGGREADFAAAAEKFIR